MREYDCHEIVLRLHQFLDGELPESEADDLRRHIEACDHCVDEADCLEALRRAVRRSCACRAPESLRVRIVTQIHQVTWVERLD